MDTASVDIYISDLEKLAERQQRALAQLGDYSTKVIRLRKLSSALGQKLVDLKSWKSDPPVYVRKSVGARRTVFHSTRGPCGHVKDPDDYERVLLGRAKKMGLQGCFSCGFRANL
ncbi:MAG: hypothetical protein ABR507_05900 [Actinomycetota bacterium]|nr:hypothetical protein [Actinomycetota bacterium]